MKKRTGFIEINSSGTAEFGVITIKTKLKTKFSCRIKEPESGFREKKKSAATYENGKINEKKIFLL